MSRRLLPAALLIAACRGPVPLEAPDVPPDVTHAALLQIAADGALLSATQLAPWSAGESLPIIARSAGDAVIAGFTSTQLAPYGGEIPVDPLERAEGACAPSLPAPAWAGRWTEDDTLEPFPAGRVPRLTAPWVRARCPSPSDFTIAVELLCPAARCAPAVRPVDACSVELDMTLCEQGRATLTVGASGETCLDAPEAKCPIEVHLSPEDITPPYRADRVRLFAAEPWIHPTVQSIPLFTPKLLPSGYLYDLLPIRGEVVVMATPGDVALRGCPDDAYDSTRLLYVDRASLAVTRTATAPPCLHRAALDPRGEGFIGTFTRGRTWHLGRFSPGGGLLEEASTGVISGHDEPGRPSRRANEIEVLPEAGAIVVVIGVALGADEGAAVLAIHDLATLELVETVELIPESQVWASAVADPRTVALVFPRSRTVGWFDVGSRRITRTLALPRDFEIRQWLFDAVDHAGSDRLLVIGKGTAEILALTHGTLAIEPSTHYELDSALLTAAAWPADRRLVLTAGTTVGTWRGIAALFDPAAGRFLPGTQDLGHGVIPRIREDAEGRLWLLSPWSAEVIRITPGE